jgi:hypothetical protein
VPDAGGLRAGCSLSMAWSLGQPHSRQRRRAPQCPLIGSRRAVDSHHSALDVMKCQPAAEGTA